MVKPVLRAQAPIAILTDPPNKLEQELGRLFEGSNGRILDKALGLANIRKDSCSLLSVGLDFKKHLASIKPTVVVAMGDRAMAEMVSTVGIQKWRGSILPSTLAEYNGKVIPTFTPEWIRRGNFQHFWSLVNDLSRTEKQSHFPDIRRPQWTSLVSPGPKEAIDYVEGIPSDTPYSLDIETRANHLACLSIAYHDKAMCFPIQNPSSAGFLPGHEGQLWLAIRRLMARNPLLVGQNLTFDLEYLFDYGLEPSGIFMDTMISHAILYPEFPKGLDFLCSMYTEMPYYKSEGKISNPKVTTEDLWQYNNKDTITTLWCALEIEKQLKARGLWPVHEFVTKELGLALEMQRNRLPVDFAKRDELKVLVKENLEGLDGLWIDNTLARLAGDPIVARPNVNSPKQVAKFLYEELKLKPKTRDGSIVADETAIGELKAAHPEFPQLGWILEERHLRKLNSSYLDIELEQDGTIGGAWCVHGTETGRWSSGKSPRGRGLNLQTVPKAIRWMCVPPGRKQ